MNVRAVPVNSMAGAPTALYMAVDTTPYAEFFTRFFAFLIDEVIAGALAVVVYLVMAAIAAALTMGGVYAGAGYGRRSSGLGMSAGLGVGMLVWTTGFLLAMAVYALYFVKQETGPKQATIGKALLGIRVTRTDGGTLSAGQSLGRLFIKSTFSWAVCLVGFFMAAFTQRKQALHDFVASSIVVKSE